MVEIRQRVRKPTVIMRQEKVKVSVALERRILVVEFD